MLDERLLPLEEELPPRERDDDDFELLDAVRERPEDPLREPLDDDPLRERLDDFRPRELEDDLLRLDARLTSPSSIAPRQAPVSSSSIRT